MRVGKQRAWADDSSPDDLVARLAAHRTVAGIVRYGGPTAVGDGGDLDLFLLVDARPTALESVHFYTGEVPVDLSVRTWADLEHEPPLTPIDREAFAGEVLYDRDGNLPERLRASGRRLRPPVALGEQTAAFLRFGERHALDKLRGRLDREPVLCRLLLESTLYWQVQHYFLVRGLDYPGEKAALRHLREHEPELWRGIERFYAAADLRERAAIAEEVRERVLAPVGGLWRRGEVLALGADPSVRGLQKTGQRFLDAIMSGERREDKPCESR